MVKDMSKIVFFCIPAHGHTNPTIEVIRELVARGNEVVYYSFNLQVQNVFVVINIYQNLDQKMRRK